MVYDVAVFERWGSKGARELDPASQEAGRPEAAHPGGLTREHVIWAYRILLDRDPESEDVIGPKLAGSLSTRELRGHLMTSAEFRRKNPDYAHTNDKTLVIKELPHVPGRVRLFLDLSDHAIGLNILRGHYEEEEIRYVASVLGPGDTALDLGAHIGFFTVQMAALVGPTGRVYAFEPDEANADLLERSVAENRFEDRIVVTRAAVGAATGQAILTFPAETLNSGGAYLLPSGGKPLAGNLARQVPVVALDTQPIRRPVRLLKIDVEGAEPQVLQGATRLLTEDRPVILSELHPTQLARASGYTVDRYLADFAALGYRPYALDGAPLGPVPEDAILSVVLLPAPPTRPQA